MTDYNPESMLAELYEKQRERLAGLTEINGKTGDYLSPVFGSGNANSKILMIGEAPGKEEAQAHRAFVGRAGQTLDSILTQAGIKRSSIFLTNAVKFRPWNKRTLSNGKISTSNRTPTRQELLDALPTLKNELFILKPRLVITMGNIPLKAVWMIACPDMKAPNISDVHGQSIKLNIIEQHERLSIELFPLYHPASTIYNRSLLSTLELDVKLLSNIYREYFKENML